MISKCESFPIIDPTHHPGVFIAWLPGTVLGHGDIIILCKLNSQVINLKINPRCVGFDNVHFKTLNGDTELRDDVKLVLFNEEMQFYVLY